MWHEARKQERKIRGMLVDYRKRAERRQDFYEKIKADPTQFMQIHSRKCKIHLDPAVAAAGDSPAIMMPWQGLQDNMIDRFDGRAYLDLDKIPVAPKSLKDSGPTDAEELSSEERLCNYERYRILAQNDFLTISEEKYLQQLHLEEQFGIHAQIELEKPKKKTGTGAAIGYTYEDSADPNPVAPFSQTIAQVSSSGGNQAPEEESDSDLDVDVAIDISKIDTAQAHELNTCGRHYGMKSNDFYSFLTRDADEADALKLAREEEQEKIMLSGRKSRRERRAQRERRFAGRTISPPSYAAKEDQVGLAGDDDDRADSADTRSPSPENSGKITYITSFGGDDELQPHSKISINFNKNPSNASGTQSATGGPSASYADKVRENLEKLKKLNENMRSPTSNSPKKPLAYQRRRSYSRSRSRSRSRTFDRRCPARRRRSRSRSRRRNSRSRNRSSRYSRSRSRSLRRSRSRRHHHLSSTTSSSSSRSPPRRRYRTPSSSSSSTSLASSSSRSTSRSKTSPVHSKRFEPQKMEVKVEPQLESTQRNNPPKLVQELPDIKVKSDPTPPAINAIIMEEPVVPIRRYYGRKRDDQSSSDEENETGTDDPDETTSNDHPVTTSNQAPSQHSTNIHADPSETKASSPFSSKFGKQPTTSTTVDTKTGSKTQTDTSVSSSSNPRDRLKRKMQILLNKQYKADKLAEIEKSERQVQMQQEREEEMRELALRLRRRQRELRHKYGTPTSSHSDDGSERRSDDDQHSKSAVKQRAPVNSKNGTASYAASASFAPKEHSPYRQHTRTRSRSPPPSSQQSDRSSAYRSQRGRPSRFSDDRPSRGRGGYSRSPSRERPDHRRSDYVGETKRSAGSRYWESESNHSGRMHNRRSGSRDRGSRGGGDSGGRGSNRNRHGNNGGDGGSSSRKLVDY